MGRRFQAFLTGSSGASYGAGVKSLLTALNQDHLVPSERSCQIVADLFGQPVSEGTLQAALAGCAAALLETETHIKQGLSQADVAHFDETGMYVAAQRGWLHSASTPQLTHYAYHEKRGSQATRAIGVLPSFQGRAIHDGFSAYWQYDCAHGLCNAHHLRELIFVHEQMGRAWAGQMKQMLLESKRAVDTAEHTTRQGCRARNSDYEARYAVIRRRARRKSNVTRQRRQGGVVQRNKVKVRTSWTAWRSTRERRWVSA